MQTTDWPLAAFLRKVGSSLTCDYAWSSAGQSAGHSIAIAHVGLTGSVEYPEVWGLWGDPVGTRAVLSWSVCMSSHFFPPTCEGGLRAAEGSP